MIHNDCESIGISRRWLMKEFAVKIGLLALGICGLLFALLLLLLTHPYNPITLARNVFLGFLGTACGLVYTAIWGRSLVLMLKRLHQLAGERLVIGDNGFQVIDGHGKLIGNVPYENVEHMELYSDKAERIGISLRVADDANTFWPFKVKDFGPTTEVSSEFSLTLGERYVESPKVIFQKLQQRYEKHMQRAGATG